MNTDAGAGADAGREGCATGIEREGVRVRDSGVHHRQVHVCHLLLTRPRAGSGGPRGGAGRGWAKFT